MKIALCGPPHSGKSVLRERLKIALRKQAPDVYPYILNTNPDGEGAWFQEACGNDPALAQQLKAAAKQQWSPERASIYAEWVRNCSQPLTFLDLGGLPDEYNRTICASATDAILIAPTQEDWLPWIEFAKGAGLRVIALLISDYPGATDRIDSNGDVVFQATIHRLERGELNDSRSAIDALSHHILTLL